MSCYQTTVNRDPLGIILRQAQDDSSLDVNLKSVRQQMIRFESIVTEICGEIMADLWRVCGGLKKGVLYYRQGKPKLCALAWRAFHTHRPTVEFHELPGYRQTQAAPAPGP